MALLLYCVAPADLELELAGVAGSKLIALTAAEIKVFYSAHDALELQRGSALQEAAVAFFDAQRTIFQVQTIVPFRFPTLVKTVADLELYARRKMALFAAELRRLAGKVQMDVVLPKETPAVESDAVSGTEYLQSRRQAMKKTQEVEVRARQLADGLAADSKTRLSDTGLHISFLIERRHIPEFHARFASQGSLRVTGPWPPAAFLSPELQSEESGHG